jgi:hypothetical protein
MDLQERVANLERTNRRWRMWFTVVIAVWPILLIAGGMSSKSTRDEEVADEIRTRTLVVVDDQGNVVGSFDASGVTMRQGNRSTEIGPSGISVAYHETSSVKIGCQSIELCGFDVEKYHRYKELREQARRDGPPEEEAKRIAAVELGKNNYEPQLVSIGYMGDRKYGCIDLSDVTGRNRNHITNSD